MSKTYHTLTLMQRLALYNVIQSQRQATEAAVKIMQLESTI